jgi:hypothetical protein
VEPGAGGVAHYLRCAPRAAGEADTGYLNLYLSITNTGGSSIKITELEVSVVNSPTPLKTFGVNWSLASGAQTKRGQPEDYVFTIPPGDHSLRLKFKIEGFRTKIFDLPLAVYQAPTPDHSYRFWAAVRDLRPGEFWWVNGTSHDQANPAQLFAYDVGVAVESQTAQNDRLPGATGKNEDYRIWGKPIYAIADGTVVEFRNDFPTNPAPGDPPPDLAQLIEDIGDGNGNFFTIATGDVIVLYAHMMAGSLNPTLLEDGAPVKKGDFLGLAGNSGASGNPHMHIHANANVGSQSWVGDPRPLRFTNARAVAWELLGSDAAAAPWVKVSGRGLPTADCAVWPGDIPVNALKETIARHFAISTDGQVWVVKTDNKIRTTSERLAKDGPVGIFLDVDPGGAGKEIAVHGSKPYIIGMDDRIFEGLPSQWAPLRSSPACMRVTVDAASGAVWVVTLDSRIMTFQVSGHRWIEHAGGGRAKDICLHNGIPYIIGLDDKIWKSVGPNGWTPLPGQGKGKRIAVNPETGRLWVVGLNDGIFGNVIGTGDWREHPGGGRAKDLFFYKRRLFIKGMDRGIWRGAGEFGWHRLNLIEPA